MRIGVMCGADAPLGLDPLLAIGREAVEAGLDDLWMANTFALDAVGALGLVGRELPNLGVGTAVTPTYPRHPFALAQQALTTAAMTDNRFTLGIGLSHRVVIEDMLGLSFERPAAHMRHYLEALLPLLAGEETGIGNEHFTIQGVQLRVPGAVAPPVVVAALGPVMLRIAGELADGTTLWMVGERTLEQHILPRLQHAADGVGRPSPRVVAAFPVAVTSDVPAARRRVDELLAIYGRLPSYRAMLDREGAHGPADVALLGDEEQLQAALGRLAALGVTHFNASIMDVEPGARARTLACLAAWCRERGSENA